MSGINRGFSFVENCFIKWCCLVDILVMYDIYLIIIEL